MIVGMIKFKITVKIDCLCEKAFINFINPKICFNPVHNSERHCIRMPACTFSGRVIVYPVKTDFFLLKLVEQIKVIKVV